MYKHQFLYDYSKAIRKSKLCGAHKLLLHTLLDYANPDGSSVRPPQALLAEECSSSRRTVNRNLSQLVAAGWLVLVKKGFGNGQWGGSRRCNEYQLQIAPEVQPEVQPVVELRVEREDTFEDFGGGMTIDEIMAD